MTFSTTALVSVTGRLLHILLQMTFEVVRLGHNAPNALMLMGFGSPWYSHNGKSWLRQNIHCTNCSENLARGPKNIDLCVASWIFFCIYIYNQQTFTTWTYLVIQKNRCPLFMHPSSTGSRKSLGIGRPYLYWITWTSYSVLRLRCANMSIICFLRD